MKKHIFLLIFGLFLGCSLVFAEMKPLKFLRERVPERVYLIYSVEIRGKVIWYDFQLWEKEENGIKIYLHSWEKGEGEMGLLRLNKEWNEIIVDMQTGDIKQYKGGNALLEYIKTQKTWSGSIFFALDRVKGEAVDERLVWQNQKEQRQIARQKVFPDLPVVTYMSFWAPGVGFYELGRGLVQFVAPNFLKYPVKAQLVVTKREKVQVGAGEFDTVRVEGRIGDPLLRLVLGRSARMFGPWWVDEKTGFQVKYELEGRVFALEAMGEYTTWEEAIGTIRRWLEMKVGIAAKK